MTNDTCLCIAKYSLKFHQVCFSIVVAFSLFSFKSFALCSARRFLSYHFSLYIHLPEQLSYPLGNIREPYLTLDTKKVTILSEIIPLKSRVRDYDEMHSVQTQRR